MRRLAPCDRRRPIDATSKQQRPGERGQNAKGTRNAGKRPTSQPSIDDRNRARKVLHGGMRWVLGADAASNRSGERRPGEGRRHVSLVAPATAAAPRDADPGNNRRPPHHTRGASGSTRAVRLSTLGLGLRRFCCVGTLARTRPSLLSPLSPAPAWRRHLATSTSPARRRKRAPAVCMVAGPTKKPERINQIDRLMDQTIRFGPRKSTIRLRALSSSPFGVYWFGV